MPGVSASCFGSGCEDFGGAFGWGERLACGAWPDGRRLLSEEDGVSELLLRRSLRVFLLSAREAFDEACRVHAAKTTLVMLCWALDV